MQPVHLRRRRSRGESSHAGNRWAKDEASVFLFVRSSDDDEFTPRGVHDASLASDVRITIYTMPGMQTKLHAVINKPGEYEGLSSNYSGDGFSHMRFKFHGLD